MPVREVELSFACGPDTALPDLTALPGVERTRTGGSADLEATYFDTRDRALLRAGVSLRRRSGGDDEGWHLKVPAGGGRDEVRLPLSRSRATPPKPLREAVRGWTRGTDLHPLATICTHRTTVDLVASDGRVLAQLMDDRVEGHPVRDGDEPAVAWREWELELVGGDPDLLDAAEERFEAEGVRRSQVQRKVERVVGSPVPAPPPLPRPKRKRPARLVLHARVAAQVAELGRRDSEVRRGEPEGVHKARVACRRLRGALATYRPLVDRSVTDPIRDELRWLAHALGDARDLDVAHDRLRGLAEAQPSRLRVGPVYRRLERTYAPRRREAHTRARAALDSERYFALRDELDRLAAAPPWTARAEAQARDVLPRRLRKEVDRLRRRVERAEAADDPREHDEAVHAARRAAKRLRYAAETLEPVWGKDAARLAKAAKKMASTLGVRQDAVVTRPELIDLARTADAAGESTFTYGLLHAEERRLADRVDDRFGSLFEKVERAALRARL